MIARHTGTSRANLGSMLHPPTESPSRDTRPPRRPGAVALPLTTALAAVLALSMTLTACGGDADGVRRAGPPTPSATPDAYGTSGTAGKRDTPGAHGADGGRTALDRPGTPRPGDTGPSARPSGAPSESGPPRPRHTGTGPGGAPGSSASGSVPASVVPASTAPAEAHGARRTTAATGGPARPAGPKDRSRPMPYDVLRVGDCFDIDRAAPGTVVRRACDTPHDAQVVARPALDGRYASDAEVKGAAAARCRGPLRAEAAEQPFGTRWATFVQYPYRTSYLLGDDRIVCSLAVPSASGRKLTAPLL
ncbi:hypothetical protein ACGFRB_24325 [Streptomyces sp. NPDC048718]|uniref:hypothetical protein n=1 Tax=Streptomyces sp. NPDC048718 TaxID=3365587 RepID=UPI00370FF15B